MKNAKIAILGLGMMGQAIARGLLKANHAKRLLAGSVRTRAAAARLREELGIAVGTVREYAEGFGVGDRLAVEIGDQIAVVGDQRMSVAAAQATFWGYSALVGLSLSTIFMVSMLTVVTFLMRSRM